ncbi:MAG: SMEK domain-containing protein [Sulfurovaceae bacterium]
MNEHLKNFEYVKEQLIYIKTKVEIDNKLGLYDINNLSESLFSNILNDTYDLNLQNSNKILYLGYPAIDLVDSTNQKVFQVTSTLSTEKIRSTIQKWKEGSYKEYQLNFFYIKEKPKLTTQKIKDGFAQEGITEANLFDINDILNILESDQNKCKRVFDTLQSHLDTLSFEFNVKNYFDSFEPHLQNVTSKAFDVYINKFLEFIASDKKVLEIYSAGGNGKSHLLYELSQKKTEYIPLIFKKNTNISEDLKKLPNNKKFLFIFDDIDRFLDSNVLVELLSYLISHKNIKLLISYRIASKSWVKTFYRKYSNLPVEEIEIVWSDENIINLIKTLNPDLEDSLVQRIHHQFNNNPYLITQALNGNIDEIKDFSRKIIVDAQNALKRFNFSDDFINTLLFNLSIIVPLHEKDINNLGIENIKEILDSLESANILRKINNRYRFNPDILGDLYLAYFIEEFGQKFKEILEKYLELFSLTVFTNISYALIYLKNKDTLSKYLENIIDSWIRDNNYSSYHLQLINKIVAFIPDKSFLYLKEATKNLTPKENNHIGSNGFLTQLFTKVSFGADFNQNQESINLGSIEPIVAQLIRMLKNNFDCGSINIKDILDYLTSDDILNLPKPFYSNHELNSILKKLFSPLRTTNYQVILDAIEISNNWIKEPYNDIKIKLFQDVVIKNLLSATFDDSSSDSINYYWDSKVLNISHSEIKKIIHKVKNIVLTMFESNNKQILYNALEIIRSNAHDYEALDDKSKKFYSDIKQEFLSKANNLIEKQEKLDFLIVSKIDEIALDILKFDNEKEEALKILGSIVRTDEFIFYQLIKNEVFIIIDFNVFYEEYVKQNDVIDWMYDSQSDRQNYNKFSKDFLSVIERLSKKYNKNDIVQLFNSLDTSNWNAYNKLLYLLEYWFDIYRDELIKVYDESYQDIKSDMIKNVLKELFLKKQIKKLQENDITKDTSVDDLKVYTTIIFKDFDKSKIVLLEKLLSVLESKDDNTLYTFINIIAGDIYFKLKENRVLIDTLDKYIYKLLELQSKHDFEFVLYLIFSLEIMKEQKNYDGLTEVALLNKFVKSYDDFILVVKKVEQYYNEFVVYPNNEQGREIRIDLDWFLKYISKKEYIEDFFNELHKVNDTDRIRVFYKIVPVSLEYLDLLIKNINSLNNIINEKELMGYLEKTGKIKTYSRSHMQNSLELLNEEKLFNQLYDGVESSSLRLRIKDKLKYIEIDKRREIESDIERLMDK